MPNWCNNKLAIYGFEKDVNRFKEHAVGHSPWTHVKEQKESPLNFHSLVPVPPDTLSAGYHTPWAPPIAFLSKVAPQWPALIFLLEHEEMGMGFKSITATRSKTMASRFDAHPTSRLSFFIHS